MLHHFLKLKTLLPLVTFSTLMSFNIIANAQDSQTIEIKKSGTNSNNLGVEVKLPESLKDEELAITLMIKAPNSKTYRTLRTEYTAPYAWGTTNDNAKRSTKDRLSNLAEGTYTIKAITKKTADGIQVNTTYKTVNITTASNSTPTSQQPVTVNPATGNSPTTNSNQKYEKNLKVSSVDGIKFRYYSLKFEEENEEEKKGGLISLAGGTTYLLVIKSNGFKPNPIDEKWFNVNLQGLEVAGIVGSGDKAMLLLKLNGKRQINVSEYDGSIQIAEITTNKELTAINEGMDGRVNRGDDKQYVYQVKRDKDAEMTFYAEDEGGKTHNGYPARDPDFKSISDAVFGNGDDLLYIITGDKTSKNIGNGAVMHLNIK